MSTTRRAASDLRNSMLTAEQALATALGHLQLHLAALEPNDPDLGAASTAVAQMTEHAQFLAAVRRGALQVMDGHLQRLHHGHQAADSR